MKKSKEYIICPFCENKHNEHKIIGTTGLINYSGYERYMTCEKCGNEFYVICDVAVTYITKKERF